MVQGLTVMVRARQVHVVTWKYRDGSGFGVVGVYAEQAEANEVYSMLEKHCEGLKTFEVFPAPFTDWPKDMSC